MSPAKLKRRKLHRGGHKDRLRNQMISLYGRRCNRKRGNGPVPELLLTADMIFRAG